MTDTKSNIDKAVSKTDWPLLREQKLALIEACRSNQTLDGLLHWVDAIQDAAEKDGHPVVWLYNGERET